jgi:hypothetical protein
MATGDSKAEAEQEAAIETLKQDAKEVAGGVEAVEDAKRFFRRGAGREEKSETKDVRPEEESALASPSDKRDAAQGEGDDAIEDASLRGGGDAGARP